MKATKGFSVSDWCRNFEITFQGEQGTFRLCSRNFYGDRFRDNYKNHYIMLGVDWGGVRREWFELICAALFDPGNGLFASFGESQQALVHPNPKRPPHLKLKHYEFAGRIVGKCLYESALGGSYRQLVRARFTRSFLAQIIGLRVHYKVTLNFFLVLIQKINNRINQQLYFSVGTSISSKMILICI